MKKNILSKLKEKLLAEQTPKQDYYFGIFMMCAFAFTSIFAFCVSGLNYAIYTHEPMDIISKVVALSIALLFMFLAMTVGIFIGHNIKDME